MFGIPLRRNTDKEDEPTCLYCGNKTVGTNGIKIETTLDKKYSSIAYHFQDTVRQLASLR